MQNNLIRPTRSLVVALIWVVIKRHLKNWLKGKNRQRVYTSYQNGLFTEANNTYLTWLGLEIKTRLIQSSFMKPAPLGVKLSFKQLHAYRPSCAPKCPPDRWWITDHWQRTLFYDAAWRLSHLCWGWKTLNCRNPGGVPFIYFYLDDLFPAEAQKDWAE